MPEGDTIFRAARTLHRALAGKTVTRFESVFPRLTRIDVGSPLKGRTVHSVSALGKWNLMRFSGELILVTHMRMSGSWHLYRPGEEWRRRRADLRIMVETSDFVAVAFKVMVAEFHTERSLARHPAVSRLGPDVLGDHYDAEEVIRRIREMSHTEIGPVLLNQRVIAGLGNEFKSEILFACGVSPFRKVASLSRDELERLAGAARRLVKLNTFDGQRTTNNGPGAISYTGFRRTTGRADPTARLWVYGRGGNRAAIVARLSLTESRVLKRGALTGAQAANPRSALFQLRGSRKPRVVT